MWTFTTTPGKLKLETEIRLDPRKLAFIHKQLVKLTSCASHEQGKGHPQEPQYPMMGGGPNKFLHKKQS